MTTANPFAQLKTVHANGIDFAYAELGSGPLALLVHGFPDTPHGWLPLMRRLAAAGYRAVAPFTRGYAPTTAGPTRKTTTSELADDVLALIEALGHDRAELLVGHDWGAATVYLATARAPERVGRLVAVGIPHPAAIKPSLRLAWFARHFITLRLPGALWLTRRNNFATIDTLYRRWSPTWEFGPEETAPVKEAFSQPGSLDAAIGYYRGAGKPHPDLRNRIQVPTMVVAGADDPAFDTLAPYEAAARKFEGGYRLETLPGGHFVQRESPEAFCDLVMDFIADDLRAAG